MIMAPSFPELFEQFKVEQDAADVEIVLTGQYQRAFELLEDAENAGLTPILIGPPGVGKTLLCRYYAQQRGKPFYWMTMDEATKPVHLVGSFDPAVTIRQGFSPESFVPGPLTQAMLEGGYFLVNELNRATEYAQNTLLEPLEERSLYLPRLGRIKAQDEFFVICSMNPQELAGTHRISEALKDRIKVWIRLDYPDRSTELNIIRANCPHADVPEETLDRIYQLVNRTRMDPDVEQPASIRAGIAMARLASVQAQREKGKVTTKVLRRVAEHVLSGSVKPRPGVDAEKLSRKLINAVMGGE